MLTAKIHVLSNSSEAEDILSSGRSLLFSDDITNQHGDATSSVVYEGGDAVGRIDLSLADPLPRDTGLFSHFVWNASVQLAVFMEEGGRQVVQTQAEPEPKVENWSVRGQRVLELGAGSGLAGIVSHFLGSEETIITDYPAAQVLANIRNNVARNVRTTGCINVQGHIWGDLNDAFAAQHRAHFDIVLVCDCIWIAAQHAVLWQSIAWFLHQGGRAWVVAGLHTGRQGMRGFFDESGLASVGLVVERLWERDVDGVEREWEWDRGVEDPVARKRWLVVAVLRRVGVNGGEAWGEGGGEKILEVEGKI